MCAKLPFPVQELPAAMLRAIALPITKMGLERSAKATSTESTSKSPSLTTTVLTSTVDPVHGVQFENMLGEAGGHVGICFANRFHGKPRCAWLSKGCHSVSSTASAVTSRECNE